MKTILVDAAHTLVVKTPNGYGVYEPLRAMLDEFTNKKIVLTNADDTEAKMYGLDKVPYEVFSLKHHPEKLEKEYYVIMLERFGLKPKDVIYIEHDQDVVKSAQSAGIKTFLWDSERRPLEELKVFLNQNI